MSQQINLATPLLLKKRYAFGLREMALGLGLILAVALAWVGGLHYQASTLETQAAQQEARQAAAQAELDQLTAAASRPVSALLTERVKATQAQVAQREALLASINGVMEHTSKGFASRLRALATSNLEGVWLNGFTLAPDSVVLKGSTLNADLLTTSLDRLGQQSAFSGMKFSGLNAAPAQSAADSKTKTAEMAGYIDFSLYSGGQAKPTAQGGNHAQ